MTTEPIVVAARVTPPEAELEIEIPADLEYFRGHFAGAPERATAPHARRELRNRAAGGERLQPERRAEERALAQELAAVDPVHVGSISPIKSAKLSE